MNESTRGESDCLWAMGVGVLAEREVRLRLQQSFAADAIRRILQHLGLWPAKPALSPCYEMTLLLRGRPDFAPL